MILADTNIWLALTLSDHSFHAQAINWLDRQSPKAPVAFCRSTQQSFLRLLTTESVMRPHGVPPMTNDAAWAVYEGLRSDRRVAWAAEPDADDVEARWRQFASRGVASPKLWMDAYLAALAVVGGHRLVTIDKAFKQFAGLDVVVVTPKATGRH
ncbi:MAG TPA: TA system VapC family ribonuclease toxin [Humisphaera sp.]